MSTLSGHRISIRAGKRILVDGVDCTAPSGTTTALLGPNGAGKSTLLRALAAVERPAEGAVRIGEHDVLGLSRRRRARLAALVEQDLHTEIDLTVRQVVALGRVPHEGMFGDDEDAAPVIAAAMDRAGVVELSERAFGSLSGGERQRVSLARALAQDTPVLLLDEPTNHLDIAAQLATLHLLSTLARSGTTVLAAVHDLSLAASWADRVVVLARGRVVAAGPTGDVLTPDLIAGVYGVRTTVLTHPTTGARVLSFDPLPLDGSAAGRNPMTTGGAAR
ncbi:MAG: ATP-binding cassette domain-containing protein [Naasia sp.]